MLVHGDGDDGEDAPHSASQVAEPAECGGFGEELGDDVAAPGAEGAAQADLARASARGGLRAPRCCWAWGMAVP